MGFWKRLNNADSNPLEFERFRKQVGSNTMASIYYIAWWNLENLFDTQKARSRSTKLKRVLGSELKGWDDGIQS